MILNNNPNDGTIVRHDWFQRSNSWRNNHLRTILHALSPSVLSSAPLILLLCSILHSSPTTSKERSDSAYWINLIEGAASTVNYMPSCHHTEWMLTDAKPDQPSRPLPISKVVDFFLWLQSSRRSSDQRDRTSQAIKAIKEPSGSTKLYENPRDVYNCSYAGDNYRDALSHRNSSFLCFYKTKNCKRKSSCCFE